MSKITTSSATGCPFQEGQKQTAQKQNAALVPGPKQMKKNKWNSPEKQDCDLSYMDEASRKQAIKLMSETESYWKCYPRIMIDLKWMPWIRALVRTAVPGINNPAHDRSVIGAAVRPQAPDTVVPTLSVRTFMDLLFRVMKWPAGSEIIMTGITIPHVIDIMKHHQLVPRVVDLDLVTFTPDMKQARSLVNEKTKMVMAAPVFGRTMQLLPELKALAKENNLYFLLDAAQCFGIQHHIDAMNADITCCSYGFIKYSTALGGAINIVKDTKLAEAVRKLDSTMPERTTKKQLQNMGKSFAVLYVDDPITYGVVRRLAETCGLDTPDIVHKATRGFPGNELIPLLRYRPHPACLSLLAERMTNKDPNVNKIRSMAGWHFCSQLPPYVQTLSAGNPERPEECTFWLHALVCRDPLTVCKILHQWGFDSSLGASQMTAVGTPAEAPSCHAAIKQVLYVPVAVECSDESRIRLIKVLHMIPQIAVESPLQDFHDHVARSPQKHAYRSPEVDALLKSRPAFQDPTSALLFSAGGPVAAALASKL